MPLLIPWSATFRFALNPLFAFSQTRFVFLPARFPPDSVLAVLGLTTVMCEPKKIEGVRFILPSFLAIDGRKPSESNDFGLFRCNLQIEFPQSLNQCLVERLGVAFSIENNR